MFPSRNHGKRFVARQPELTGARQICTGRPTSQSVWRAAACRRFWGGRALREPKNRSRCGSMTRSGKGTLSRRTPARGVKPKRAAAAHGAALNVAARANRAACCALKHRSERGSMTRSTTAISFLLSLIGSPAEQFPLCKKPFACLRATLLPCPVSKARTFVQYWLPVLLWMALIFSASSDSLSFQHSSRIISPFIHWLFPSVTNATVHSMVVLVRKAAHLTEYAVLAVLVWRLVERPSLNPTATWRWSGSLTTLLIVMLYAASDEFHQKFVPSRQASVWDVLIDITGGFFALLLVWVVGRWRQRW